MTGFPYSIDVLHKYYMEYYLMNCFIAYL